MNRIEYKDIWIDMGHQSWKRNRVQCSLHTVSHPPAVSNFKVTRIDVQTNLHTWILEQDKIASEYDLPQDALVHIP